MAIQFAPIRYLSRSKNDSAVYSSAYNSRSYIRDERTGELHGKKDWLEKADLKHHHVLLPDGEHSHYQNLYVLWNLVEAAERRSNSQVAKEIVLPMPNELVLWIDRIELTEGFVREHFVKHGLVAQIDWHDEPGNPHAHVLVTTRRFKDGRFSDRKARDLDPVIKRGAYGRAFVAEGEIWCRLWAEHQRQFFAERKLDIIVDPIAIVPGRETFGPKRSWHGPKADIPERIADLKRLNTEAARDPKLVFEHLERTQKRFDGRVLNRFLEKHLPPHEREPIRTKVEELKREALESARHADKVPSRSRPLTLEDLARELSPEYKRNIDEARRLKKKVTGITNIITLKHRWAREFSYEQAIEYDQMPRWKRMAQNLGLYTGPRTQSYEDRLEVLRHDVAQLRQRREEYEGKLRGVNGRAKAAWDKIRDEAERVLEQRQRIASNARQALENYPRMNQTRRREEHTPTRTR